MKKPRQELCAIYCRVSTESQRDADTIESQKTLLPKYARSQGWTVYDTYIDEGISGSFIEGRTDFTRLMRDMQQRKFTILLVAEHSRVTRTDDPGERGQILKLLKDNHIKLASPAEGILDLSLFTGELMTTLKFMFAGEEKREMMRRFKRGREEKLSKGVYCLGSVSYGLRKLVDKSVKPIKHEVVIDSDESQVLRTVFDLIVKEGKSINDCCYHLNTNCIFTRRAKPWAVGNLSRILKNEGGLTGTIYAGRYQWKTDESGKQRLLGVKPRSEGVAIPIPAIFTKQEFKVLREKIDSNKRVKLIKKEGFLLRGKLRCAMCGAKFSVLSGGDKNKMVRYYACHNRRKSPKRRAPGETPCRAPFVNMQVLDTQIERNLLIDLFMRPEKTLKKWTGTKAQHHKLDRIERKLNRVKQDLLSNDKAASKLLRGFLKDLFTEGQVQAEQDRLQGQRKLLEEEQQRLHDERSHAQKLRVNLEVVKSSSEQIKELAKEAYKKFKNMSFWDKQKLIGHLIPPGTYLRIEPALEDEIKVLRVKLPGMKRRVKIDWDYSYSGLLNLQAVIDALEVYVKTNEMPDPAVTYTEINYDS